MRTRRLVATAAIALAVTATGGCGADAPAPEAVAWVGAVCGSLAGYTAVTAAPPALEQTDTAATVAALRGYATDTRTAIEAALVDLAAVGVSPVEGGDAFVARLTDRLGRYRDGFATLADELDRLDPDATPEAAGAALRSALEPLTTLAPPEVDLDPGTPLGRAAEEAGDCRAIRTASS
jgi:hypothetical protein